MSYDIYLKNPVDGKTIEFDSKHMMTGGMYALGGTTEAWLNVTYNYAKWYYMDGVFADTTEESKGIRTIYGMTGADSIQVLTNAIDKLENCKDDMSVEERKEYEEQGAKGYWLPTRKNAIRPLYQLLAMAKMRPDGVWDGD